MLLLLLLFWAVTIAMKFKFKSVSPSQHSEMHSEMDSDYAHKCALILAVVSSELIGYTFGVKRNLSTGAGARQLSMPVISVVQLPYRYLHCLLLMRQYRLCALKVGHREEVVQNAIILHCNILLETTARLSMSGGGDCVESPMGPICPGVETEHDVLVSSSVNSLSR